VVSSHCLRSARWSASVLPDHLREADAPGRVLRAREDALGVEPDPEAGHVVGLVAKLVQGLVPVGQDFSGGRVEVAADRFVPDGQLIAVVFDQW
jgi:hypothetical protein